MSSENPDEYINEETGEVLTTRGLSWFKTYVEGLPKLSHVCNSTMRVFFHLCENMNGMNDLRIVRTKIADELAYTRQTVGGCLDELEEHSIVTYRGSWCSVNPEIVWRGKEDAAKQQAVAVFYNKLRKNRLYKNG